jgi:hypothetical protein
VNAIESGLAGENRVVEIAPRAAHVFRAHHDCQAAERLRGVASERFTQRSVPESPIAVFDEETEAREEPEQTIQRGCIGALVRPANSSALMAQPAIKSGIRSFAATPIAGTAIWPKN